MLREVGIIITSEERENIEVAESGWATGADWSRTVVYINTDRYCAKELISFPRQPVQSTPSDRAGNPGKMETFRCTVGVESGCLSRRTDSKIARKTSSWK